MDSRMLIAVLSLLTLASAALAGDDVGKFAGQVETLLKDMPEVAIKRAGNTVFVDGVLTTLEKANRLEKIVAALHETPQPGGAQVQSLVKIAPEALTAVADRIERDIGSPEILVRAVRNTLILEGVAENDFEADRAIEVTKMYLMEKPATVAVHPASSGGREISAQPATLYVLPQWQIIDLLRVRPRAAGKIRKSPR